MQQNVLNMRADIFGDIQILCDTQPHYIAMAKRLEFTNMSIYTYAVPHAIGRSIAPLMS